MISKISILGGGWLGSPLALSLTGINHDIKVSVRSEESLTKLEALGLEAFLIDLDDNLEIDQSFLDCETLIVSTPNKNIDGHARLIKVAEILKIKKIIFTSSTSVYENSDAIVTETSLLKETKLKRIEDLYINSAIPAVILRLGGLVGENRHPGGFFKNKQGISRPGAQINLVHQLDIIAVILKLIDSTTKSEIYNIVSSEHPDRFSFYQDAYFHLNGTERNFNSSFDQDSIAQKTVSGEKIEKIIGRKIKLSDHYKFL